MSYWNLQILFVLRIALTALYSAIMSNIIIHDFLTKSICEIVLKFDCIRFYRICRQLDGTIYIYIGKYRLFYVYFNDFGFKLTI